MAIVKVSWSGGKDSTCALHMHLMQGDYVKAVCYIPMFTKDIPMILKDHYEFILNTAEKFRKMGAEVYIVSGMTYYDYVLKKRKKGAKKGKISGFPSFVTHKCGLRTFSKDKALKSIVLDYDYEDIGIAYDEVKRQGQLNDKKRSILVEKEITEKQAFEICREKNILSPHYNLFKRDGCALCPHAKKALRKLWLEEYPEAFDILLYLQDRVKTELPSNYTPLSNGKFFIEEDQQMDIFSDEIKYKIN